jgi:hypothetical protein
MLDYQEFKESLRSNQINETTHVLSIATINYLYNEIDKIRILKNDTTDVIYAKLFKKLDLINAQNTNMGNYLIQLKNH